MKKRILWALFRKKYYGIVTSVSAGLFIIISLVCMCGLCMSHVDVPDKAVYAISCFILGMGGYVSGVTFGKNKRCKGIVSGFICGLWLWGIITIFGIVAVRGLFLGAVLKNFLFLCIPAVIGGIYGVNSKIKNPPY